MATLTKLLFTFFIWHIWRERNARIFKKYRRRSEYIIKDIISKVHSRCLFLGVHVPSHIESRWNLPPFVPLVHPPIEVGLAGKEFWRMSIAFLSSFMIGVLWSDTGDPNFGTMI